MLGPKILNLFLWLVKAARAAWSATCWPIAFGLVLWASSGVSQGDQVVLEKNGYLKKNAKTNDVNAENSFSTESYLNSPSTSFGS